MIASLTMDKKPHIICVIGPTASGKSAKAVALAIERGGEIISVDSRQVYRTLNIGTEKTSKEEMQGIPHHLIDIREPEDTYSAGDFAHDAEKLIQEITARGKVPILAGGSHYYFDALLYGVPEEVPKDATLRAELEKLSVEELFTQIKEKDPRRAEEIDPQNHRRLVRALEIISTHGKVPERSRTEPRYDVEWVVINPPTEVLRERIVKRLESALTHGLIEEVRKTRERVRDARLNELGLEYRIIGEYLRGEREKSTLLPALSSKLFQYARRQKAWIRKLSTN